MEAKIQSFLGLNRLRPLTDIAICLLAYYYAAGRMSSPTVSGSCRFCYLLALIYR